MKPWKRMALEHAKAGEDGDGRVDFDAGDAGGTADPKSAVAILNGGESAGVGKAVGHVDDLAE